MRFFITLLLFFLFFEINAQEITNSDSLKRTTAIVLNKNDNKINYSTIDPPLYQISGAPIAFYTYYWEFGDGNYSMQKTPSNNFSATGEYNTQLWVTNNYDSGKAPSTRPEKVKIDKVSFINKNKQSNKDEFSLKRNREPMPKEDFVVILSYKNKKDYPLNGKLYLFYNEVKYKSDNFKLTDTRIFNNERQVTEEVFASTNRIKDDRILFASNNNWEDYYTQIDKDSTYKTDLSNTLENSKTKYKKHKIFEFENMAEGDERNMFFTFRTTPEMLKDTSATISIRGVYVPDRNFDNHSVKDMEMEIVTSHDPNKMSNDATFMSYRFVKNRRVNYKVRFQNNGEGPAKTIRLEIDVPKMYDKSSIVIEDLYPYCNICTSTNSTSSCIDTLYTEDQAIFTFKNIYLPGSNQEGVSDIDSTKGFVKYSIKFNKDFHKKSTKSRTAIIFDKNDPILTNYSSTRFLTGVSIGIKSGYNSYGDLNNSTNYFIGATISPYKSYRWYLQLEMSTNFHKYSQENIVESEVIEGKNNIDPIVFTQVSTIKSNFKNIDIEVPIILKFNINNYIGLGIGAQSTITTSSKQSNDITNDLYDTRKEKRLIKSENHTEDISSTFNNFRGGLLFDLTAGFSRIGPSLGARYVLSSKAEFNHVQLYAIWKF